MSFGVATVSALSIFQPDVPLIAVGGPAETGEYVLAQHVLLRARDDVEYPCGARVALASIRYGTRICIHCDALDWIVEEEDVEPWSFVWLCEILRLDPGAARGALLRGATPRRVIQRFSLRKKHATAKGVTKGDA